MQAKPEGRKADRRWVGLHLRPEHFPAHARPRSGTRHVSNGARDTHPRTSRAVAGHMKRSHPRRGKEGGGQGHIVLPCAGQVPPCAGQVPPCAAHAHIICRPTHPHSPLHRQPRAIQRTILDQLAKGSPPHTHMRLRTWKDTLTLVASMSPSTLPPHSTTRCLAWAGEMPRSRRALVPSLQERQSNNNAQAKAKHNPRS
jgi:hypothetical protein